MGNRPGKRSIIIIVTAVMLISLAFPLRLWAIGYDPINMDLNDPTDPIRDTCWIQRGQTAYVFSEMRPIIVGTQKFVYTDPSYGEQYLLTGTEYPIAPEDEVTLWVKFVQVLWNGDTQSKYYYVIVHGPPSSDVVYMKSLAGEEIHPLNGEGTTVDPYKATIYISDSITEISRNDITRDSTSGVGYIYTDGNYQYLVNPVKLNNREEHVYIHILNSDGHVSIFYDITVIRKPDAHFVTFLDWDGKELDTQEVEDGEGATAPNNPDNREGWHFVRWDKDYSVITEDLDVTAVYEKNEYTVTYKANGGTETDITDKVLYDDGYTVGDNKFAVPKWYEFAGWNTEADGSGEPYDFGDPITIKGNKTLYAQWSKHVPSKPKVRTGYGDSLLYLLWENADADDADSYNVTYYETGTEDIATAVEQNIPIDELVHYDEEVSFYIFNRLENDVEYTFEVQAVITVTGETSEVESTTGTPKYMGDPGGYNTDLKSIQEVNITPPPGGWLEEHGNTLVDPYEITITVPRDIGNIIIHRNYIEVADSASFIMYSDIGYSSITESMNRFGTGITWLSEVYINLKVTSANTLAVKYYRITVK